MNRILISVLLLSMMIFFSTEMDAQRKSRKRSSDRTSRTERTSSRSNEDDTERISLRDRLAYDIHIGNIGFNQGFNISMKGAAGYKVSERFTVGLGTKVFYLFRNSFGTAQDVSLFTYAGYVYPRFKISESVYLKGEFNMYSIDYGANADRVNTTIPMLGGGYVSGFGPWKFGIEILFIPIDRNRDELYGDVFEYTISILYNF